MEQLERALLRLEARLDKVLERLLARRRGAAAHNTTVLVLLELVTGQTAGRVVRRAVPDLRTGTDACQLSTARLRVIAIVALVLTRAIRHIGFYLNRRFFSSAEQVLSLCVFALRTVLSIHVSRSANSSVGSRERACWSEIEDR